MKRFKQWFVRNFKCEPPAELMGYLKDHPDGSSGSSGSLYGVDDIIAYTEERELEEKGVLYIGTGEFLSVFLFRAADGKVFLVDENNFQAVDATFRDLEICMNLLHID